MVVKKDIMHNYWDWVQENMKVILRVKMVFTRLSSLYSSFTNKSWHVLLTPSPFNIFYMCLRTEHALFKISFILGRAKKKLYFLGDMLP